MHENIPHYLVSKYQLVATCTFTAFFALVFMVVSIPFSHNAWFELGTSEAFGFTVVFFLIALAVVIVSKRVMYVVCKRADLTFGKYILWNVCEVVAVSVLYTAFSFGGQRLGIIDLHGLRWGGVFGSALVYCTVSLIIPYIIAGMYFAILDKNNTIRLMNYSNVVSDQSVAASDARKITLFDNSGVLKLSVSSSNLFYIESDDNYIRVWYTDNGGEFRQYMLRCRLKTVEESFRDSPLVRCHRKYIVNMDKVRVLRRESGGYELVLDNDGIAPIPVTKTYAENVLSKFNATKSAAR